MGLGSTLFRWMAKLTGVGPMEEQLRTEKMELGNQIMRSINDGTMEYEDVPKVMRGYLKYATVSPSLMPSDLKQILRDEAGLYHEVTNEQDSTTITIPVSHPPTPGMLENIYWPVGTGPGDVTVTPGDSVELKQAKLDAVNKKYRISQELWDKFRTEEERGAFYMEQLQQYILDYESANAPPGVSAKEYADVVERAIRHMSHEETPPRVHYSYAQDKLVISPSGPDLVADLGVEEVEIPEDMLS